MKQRVKLTFPQHLIKEPVVFMMARKYDVVPNIRWARITGDVGEMDLVIEGTGEDLDKGLQSLREQGVVVKLLAEEDSVE